MSSAFIVKRGATMDLFYDSIEEGRLHTVARGRAPVFDDGMAKTIVRQLTALGHTGFEVVLCADYKKVKAAVS